MIFKKSLSLLLLSWSTFYTETIAEIQRRDDCNRGKSSHYIYQKCKIKKKQHIQIWLTSKQAYAKNGFCFNFENV